MNIFSDQTYHIQANKVHFDNVQGYYRMLLDKPEIIFLGEEVLKIVTIKILTSGKIIIWALHIMQF